jgi:signal transduction histidine kinase
MNAVENEEFTFLNRKILDLNKQLMESEKGQSCFLSLVACELNNPMTALLGMIPHLSPPIGDPKEGIFQMVHEQALLLASRIENLVAASEIEGGQIELSHALVDPKALIDEAIVEFTYRLRAKKITVEIEDNLHEKIVSDPKKLYMIIKNVLANACDYGDAQSVVQVRIGCKEENVEIAITNQGKGPSVKHKPEVFTRFSPRNEGQHGLGLGLSIAREFCTLLEGNIDYDVDDTSVTFTITLPLTEENCNCDASGSNEFMFESFDGACEV